MKRTIGLYNMIPNLIWSVILITPVFIYCYRFLSVSFLYSFLAISIIPVFLTRAFMDKLQLSQSTQTYKRIGVHQINRFSQNGTIINKLAKRRFPEYKAVVRTRSSMEGLIRQTYVFEKFHWILFLFFTMVTGFAFIHQQWEWALILLIANIAYNLYPNLLQQYIRLKLKSVSSSKR